ncbi:MAG: SOS response-associated peptidase family protein [Acidobacteriaceae bacterium]|nr:SOS response-associated peptidase family protein [Acidobacteriaceae bacterium]
MMFWRFLPRFVTDPKKFRLSTINAKSEALLSNQMWQDSFLRRRCLVPIDTFIEWRKEGKRRVSFVFAMKDDSPFALGGVWRRWRSPDRSRIWIHSPLSRLSPMSWSPRRPVTTACL